MVIGLLVLLVVVVVVVAADDAGVAGYSGISLGDAVGCGCFYYCQ